MSARTVLPSGGVGSRRANSMDSVSRSGAKPECIAALIERALARADGSTGHSPASGCRSASASQIARLSNTANSRSPSVTKRTGTLWDGVSRRICARVSARRSAIVISSNGAPVARMARYGLKLQLDQFLVPTMRRYKVSLQFALMLRQARHDGLVRDPHPEPVEG